MIINIAEKVGYHEKELYRFIEKRRNLRILIKPIMSIFQHIGSDKEQINELEKAWGIMNRIYRCGRYRMLYKYKKQNTR